MLDQLSDRTPSARIGRLGESIACAFLQQRGFRVIARNIEFPRLGEVDILAENGGVLHFIEVKSSVVSTLGLLAHPINKLNRGKLDRIIAVMQKYCFTRNITLQRCVSSIAVSVSRETMEARCYFEERLYVDSL